MIELKSVTKKYEVNQNNIVTALDDVSLKIESGKLVVLRGSSGSGKSTILSLIAGLSKPTYGNIIVDEKQISKLPDNFATIYRRDNIGFIFQRYNLIPTLSVEDNILLPLIPLNLDENLLVEKLKRVTEMFNISHKVDATVRNLSGGEQQRVAIARANINNPKIIIADEPTANLDAKLSQDFISQLSKLKETGKTIVVATHDPLFFELDFVDEFIDVKNGKILSLS